MNFSKSECRSDFFQNFKNLSTGGEILGKLVAKNPQKSHFPWGGLEKVHILTPNLGGAEILSPPQSGRFLDQFFAREKIGLKRRIIESNFRVPETGVVDFFDV